MINCLIVEDEPLAAEVLKDYIAQVPFLHLKEICTDALFALDILKKEKIDLLFLDIHLPGLKGTEMLSTLMNPPKVILTTAYHEYALQGYEMNVVDYLLKPIEFNRFLQAVNKIEHPSRSGFIRNAISIQADKRKVIIETNEILFVESQKEYIFIQTLTNSFTTKYALSKIESELDPNMFLRIHRSFIVSLHHVKAYNTNEVQVRDKLIPIGGNYKEVVLKKLTDLF